jgi:[ribosomal protein S5]-alanine N-acetyltransferase
VNIAIFPRGKALTRLRLLPVTAEMKEAMRASRLAFAQRAIVALPDGWPEFPQALLPQAATHPAPWTGYLFLSSRSRQLIGNGGFVAPPDAEGLVEIRYEIAPQFRNLGCATEAVTMLRNIARTGGARTLIAHTLAEPNASNAVLRKIGMVCSGESQRGPLKVWQWRVDLHQADGISGSLPPIAPQDPADSPGR